MKTLLLLLLEYFLDIYRLYRITTKLLKIGKLIKKIFTKIVYIYKQKNKRKMKKIKEIYKKKIFKSKLKYFFFIIIFLFFSDYITFCESNLVNKYFTQEEIEEILNMDIDKDERKNIIRERINEKLRIERENELLNLLLYFGIGCFILAFILWFIGYDDDDGSSSFSEDDEEEEKLYYYQRSAPSKQELYLTQYQRAHLGKKFLRDRISPFCVYHWFTNTYMHDLDIVDKISQEIDDWEDRNIYNKSRYQKKED